MTVAELINKIGFKVKKEDVDKVNSTMSDIKDKASKLLGAIGVAFSASALNTMIEDYGRVNDQIRNSTKALGDQKEIQEKILAAAGRTRTTYQQTATVVANLVHENSELFGTIDEAIAFNDAATMLFKTAGKTNEDIAGLMEAINKSFAKGYIDSETLSQLLERAPEAVELLNGYLGTTSDQLEQLASDGQFSVAQLKDAFVSNADSITQNFANVQYRISEAITHIRDKFGYWLADLNEATGLTDTLAKWMVSGFNKVMGVLSKVRDGVIWLTNKLGGMENALKLILIVAAALLLVLNFNKIISGIKGILSLLNIANLKLLALVAIVAAVLLIIEDFYHFMKGNDSLLGDLLAQAGVDCEALRETIISSWEEIKQKLAVVWEHIKTAGAKVWEALKTAAESIFEGLKVFWEKWGESITETFGVVFEGIGKQFDAFLSFLTGIADFIGAVFSGDWEAAWQAILQIGTAIWDNFIAYLSNCWEILKLVFEIALDMIGSLLTAAWEAISEIARNVWKSIVEFITSVLNSLKQKVKEIWNKIKNTITSVLNNIKTTISNVWNAIKAKISEVLNNIKNTISEVWNAIKNFLAETVESIKRTISEKWEAIRTTISDTVTRIWEKINEVWTTIKTWLSDTVTEIWEKIKETFNNIWESISETIGNIYTTITEGLQKAIDWIRDLPSQAWQWGADIIDELAAGIESAISKASAAAKKIATEVWNFLHFSEPEEGPLSDFHTYMPDMISLMAKGILDGRNKVRDAMEKLTGEMSVIASASYVAPTTAVTAQGGHNIVKNIIQTVRIENEFNGDKAIQREASNAMKQSARDVTSELAKGLNFT